MTKSSQQGQLAGMSIQQKLPLLMSALLIAVIVLFSVGSYRAVQQASVDVARQRLLALTQQLSELFDQSAKAENKASHALATDKAIAAFASAPSQQSRDAALNSLLRTTGPRPELTMRAAVLDLNGNTLLSMTGEPPERHEELGSDLSKAVTSPDFAAIGRFRLINDTLVLPAVGAIMDGSRPVAYVVRWRRVNLNPKARDQLAALLGSKASLYIGNDRGDVWTDFATPVPKPPADANLEAGKISQYSRPGAAPVLATMHAVTDAPWVVVVEFSREAVMAPAAAFLRRSLLIGLAVVLAGTLLVWLVSRSITKPLAELTGAATALAAGDFSTVVDTGRDDELGTLSRSFNKMVGHVEAAQQGLEVKVRERTEQLRERNEELEAFGHSISHDLRAPLRAMHGFSQALLEDCGPQLDATGKDYAQRVVAGARRMDSLIQDLLAYSRITRADMDVASVPVSDVVRDALIQLEADLKSSGGTVEVDGTLPVVRGNRVALVQVVANLVSNALKFVPSGRTPVIHVRSDESHGKARVWIEDNGIGIDPAHQERVFGVFERLNHSEIYPGTGIGLAIVRKSVERMGGRTGVDSTPGSGSRFWIELAPAGAE